jgi:hypothetical protein
VNAQRGFWRRTALLLPVLPVEEEGRLNVQNLKQFAEIQARLRRIAAEARRLATTIEHIKKQLTQVAAASRGNAR